uniref:hypothetical protein n=1 Tax=Rickettsia endosymbiont of Urophora cardui TaxID=3066265 RepID=UPI00313E1A34
MDIRTQKVFLTLNRSKRTQDVIGNMNKKLKQLSHIIKSITLDNGKEFTKSVRQNSTSLIDNMVLRQEVIQQSVRK